MPLIDNVASAQHHPARITQPHVRKGWLDHGPGAPLLPTFRPRA
jgi:biotin/methionine sulfoxide reductase